MDLAFFSKLPLFFYLLSMFFYLLRLIVNRPFCSVIGLRLVVLGGLLQLGGWGLRLGFLETSFLFEIRDYFSLSSLIVVFVFVFLCFSRRFYAAGPFFIAIIVTLFLLSMTYSGHNVESSQSVSLAFHVSSFFLALSMFAVSLISALLFLIAEKEIKTKDFSLWKGKLPSLEMLDDVHHKSLVIGFVLFTVTILTGAVYAQAVTGRYFSQDLKQILSFLLWMFFATLLYFRIKRGWTGHKGVVLSLMGFSILSVLFFVGLS